jgi:ElaB/YqjD/DUF883 family membrane-anchored ribosome-binding protein
MNESTAPVTKQKLLDDFNAVASDTEQLLKSLASEGGEKAAALRASIDQNLKAARERLARLEEAVVHRGKAAAQATDAYVHQHPWQAIGIAAGLGVVVGLLLNRR